MSMQKENKFKIPTHYVELTDDDWSIITSELLMAAERTKFLNKDDKNQVQWQEQADYYKSLEKEIHYQIKNYPRSNHL